MSFTKTRIGPLIFFIWLLPLSIASQTTKEDFTSSRTGDTYRLIIRRPYPFDSTKAYHHVYFTDAAIKSGRVILNQPDDSTKNCILIGIAHTGDWNKKRRRDLIPSDAGGYRNDNFGQASKFFLFMKEELMPYVTRKFGKQKTNVIIGHSFGGLFALYISMRENKLFDHYYVISPSVWANYRELMKIENDYANRNKNYNSSIAIYAGSLEFLNKVLSSSKEFYDQVKERKYNGLIISRAVINGVNHYGIVPRVIPWIFRQLRNS
ncbi:MAG TPA: alpha/beta hydrolase-fold protein [Chitinophagaceae bacterium]|nr:alpha/beta hydrolase-fold protein [Chitinophagaceae bacterium]